MTENFKSILQLLYPSGYPLNKSNALNIPKAVSHLPKLMKYYLHFNNFIDFYPGKINRKVILIFMLTKKLLLLLIWSIKKVIEKCITKKRGKKFISKLSSFLCIQIPFFIINSKSQLYFLKFQQNRDAQIFDYSFR